MDVKIGSVNEARCFDEREIKKAVTENRKVVIP
jgi:hypothetical protein